MSSSLDFLKVIEQGMPIIGVAFFGGLVLFFLKVADHFNRKKSAKYTGYRYAGYMAYLFLTLPVLGAAVATIYLSNGDKLSTILAFQVGLTSPAIVQRLIVAAADSFSKEGVATSPGQ
ncbi:hypothetical protein I5V54_07835 [Stenotrophomonas maltophilia]|nr:hypothetical protein [Stenotrophomonas maltophilia]MBH1843655.1 hypothetical protein [Stenotrophomonas maltophilia]